MLSLISVLVVIVILVVGTISLAHLNAPSLPHALGLLQVTLLKSRPDEDVFARTKIAKFLFSLLVGNLVQTVGGLLNIAWLVENRVYVGVTCSAQAALKQIGNV
jgi:hypothetical protein